MRILLDSIRALRENSSAAAVYVLLCVGTSALKRTGDLLIGSEDIFTVGPVVLRSYQFTMDLLIALGYTMACVLAFSRIGRAIDRPLWKIATDREALRRFFVLWLLIDLALVTTSRLLQRAVEGASSSEPALFLFLLLVAMSLLAVPVGACVMFSGRFQWRDVPANLAPLVHRLSLTFSVMAVNFLAVVFAFDTVPRLAVIWPELSKALWFRSLVDVPLAVVDCYVFAATWLICMLHRNESAQQDDYGNYGF